MRVHVDGAFFSIVNTAENPQYFLLLTVQNPQLIESEDVDPWIGRNWIGTEG